MGNRGRRLTEREKRWIVGLGLGLFLVLFVLVAWYAAAMDASHVIRSSTAVIVDGVLRVQSGPLVGQEPRISKVDRHRRRCQVLVGEGDTAFTEQAPIDVPFKS